MGCISSKQAVLNASPVLEPRRKRHRRHASRWRLSLANSRSKGGRPRQTHILNVSTSKGIPQSGSGVLSYKDDDDNKDVSTNTDRNSSKLDKATTTVHQDDNDNIGNKEEEDIEPQHKHDHEHEHDKKCEDENEEEGRDGLRSVGSKKLRNVEAEHEGGGWPSWLSSVAGEAIHGWVPLKAESYEKLDKIGQGTYSSVFRAREVETGRIVALKKVQFDKFQRESVRFMAREIMILRKLDHPNILKLEGIITSRLSCSIYLVFEYMEHDLSGLVSSPDVNFTEPQIKCYMKQLLAGVEHCHMRGVMHRDIKTSNILVNNQGVLKLGDFGLANILNSRNRQSLTSRVVTLWYRPPELLMGSTDYRVSVDLWSVGCVFAELLTRKPFLKARTEVEQLHKIFKLCGTPGEDYWKQCRLPLASMFKPHQTYDSSLGERCKDFPLTATNLIQTLLSIEPYNRGTASSALISPYFMTKPLACEPWSLPKYPPNKEIDAKVREEARRKKNGKSSSSTRKQRKGRKDTNGVPKRGHVHENHGSGKEARRKCIGMPTSSSFAWDTRKNEHVASTLSYNMSFTGLVTSVDSNAKGASDNNNDGMSYPRERVEFSLSSQPDKIYATHVYDAAHNPSFE